MNGKLFRFLQVNIHVQDELIDKFSKFCPLLIMDSIPDDLIPSHMHEYQTKTRQKRIWGFKKLLSYAGHQDLAVLIRAEVVPKPWVESNSHS